MTGERPVDVAGLTAGIARHERRALAQAITLVESTRPDHRAAAEELLRSLPPAEGDVVRIGITGAPGVGKSTLIEALGQLLVRHGDRVAVLAIDPSSARTGGSILGDKTRMVELSRSDNAFIRPSPAGATLGGVARRTREAMHLCEAAGYRRVIVETVGVGQSETAVAAMTDLFVLLVAPAGGDELQGIKRGIMELADFVVVNKADGDLEQRAAQAVGEYRSALGLMIPRHAGLPAQALAVSARDGTGLEGLWEAICVRRDVLRASGELTRLRADQARDGMWAEVREGLVDYAQRAAAASAADLELRVMEGRLLPHLAAAQILEELHAAMTSGGGATLRGRSVR
jgi:LAO/AO transport system kinase